MCYINKQCAPIQEPDMIILTVFIFLLNRTHTQLSHHGETSVWITNTIVLHLIDQTRLDHDVMEHAPETSLAVYAAVSRKWQNIVEPIAFRHLNLTSIKLATTEADNRLAPARLVHTRFIRFDFEFPAHDLAAATDLVDHDNQLVFDSTVQQLFNLLARIPPHHTFDIMSQAFFHFTQRNGLYHFDLEGSIDSMILQPQSQNSNDKYYWPTLRSSQLEISPVLPSSQQIEILDSEEEVPESLNDLEEDEWETEFLEEECKRFFTAVYDQGIMD
ncbi:hypothetical protein AK830_g2335 [Neonectria ditissima]|uniref:F-box domain-containing protein n=1 Tax=Neonectria ditissima TaxID=78410 RepID=A0A0N8H8C5_9HYPO|nr:hypothetical protein AK830_g2335 [Neonectria ditissima]